MPKRKPIFTVEQMLVQMHEETVPVMVQHCMIKVAKNVKGSLKNRVYAAYNICAATFGNGGYLNRGRLRKGKIRKTGKGMARDRKHQREKLRSRKRTVYNMMVKRAFGKALKRLEEKKEE